MSTRVVVVDNASSDDSVVYLQSTYQHVEIIALDCNVGYAGGANIGLRQGNAPYAFVMNADVIVRPDHLQCLVERLECEPMIGAAQGKLYRIEPEEFNLDEESKSNTIDSAGHRIHHSRMVVDRGEGEPDSPEFSREASVFSACGAALFLRRTMLDDLAPDGEYFDSDFFAYKEDIDLCWRARILGWDIRYIPTAVAYHVRSWTGKGAPPKVRVPLAARRHSWKNHYLLILKNDRLRDLLRAVPAVLGWEIVRLGYAILRDPSLYGSYLDLFRLLPSALRQRRALLARARVRPAALGQWFGAPAVIRDSKEPQSCTRSPAIASGGK